MKKPSFSSLPHGLALNCLARISRTHRPILSLVSKRFQSLLASPELEAKRTLIGKPEKCLYVCLNLNNKPNPTWFILLPSRKLIPVPSFPYQHLISSTVISMGSDIYIIGGGFLLNGRRRRSKRMFLFDCKSHQWRKLPKMRVARKEATADVIHDGHGRTKIQVIGGGHRRYEDTDNFGEVYDPKTQTWFPLGTFLDLENSTSSFVFRGKRHHSVGSLNLSQRICLVKIENDPLCQLLISNGKLVYIDLHAMRWAWTIVEGLEELSPHHLVSMANHAGGNRVIVWWKTTVEFSGETEIWCAEIFCFRHGGLWGLVEWSKNVFTCQGSLSDSNFVVDSALVTHDF